MKKIRYCNNCGELLDEGAKFCRECGAPVLTDSEKTVQNVSDPSGMNWQDMDQVTQTLGPGAEQNREAAGQDFPFDRMPDGKNQKNSNRDRLLVIIAGVILAILIVILVLLIYRRMGPSAMEPDDSENAGNITTITQSQEDTAQEKTDSEDAVDDSNENASGSNVTDADESESDDAVTENDNSPEGTDSADAVTESGTQDSGYILPDSADRVYSRSEIEALTDTELLYALNEIYARHGRIFKDEQIREYFESQSWYHGTVSGETFDPTQDQVFNTYEKQNRDLITDVMEERGLR